MTYCPGETDGNGYRICIVQPNPASASETFLEAHARNLPAQVVVVHSDPPCIGDRPVLDRSGMARLARAARRLLVGRRTDRERDELYLRALRIARPDAVLAEYGTMGVRVAGACRELGVPLVVHFHGFDASINQVLETHRESYPALFRDASAVVAVSRPMRLKLIGLGAPAEKVHWNPCGVDCSTFGGAAPADRPPVFLAVGRLVEKKGPLLTLEAFAELIRQCPEARLRIIGDGPMREACYRRSEHLGIAAEVEFLGARPHSAVREEMRRARCFVQHSVVAPSGDREGTPVGILEAGASGLPVVATRHEGIPDVVVEGETGLLVDERDVGAMAAAMLRMAREPALAGAMGGAARRHIESRFTLERSTASLWSIIRSTMDGQDPRPSELLASDRI